MSESVPTNPAASGAAIGRAAPPAPLRLEVTSEPAAIAEVRRAVERFAADAGLDPTAAGELGLSVNEAVANVIRHAYGGTSGQPIVVAADAVCDSAVCEAPNGAAASNCPPAGVRVTIRDWGSGVNPAALPSRPRDPATPGGLGLICLRELMDSVAYTPQPDGMLLTLVKRKKQC